MYDLALITERVREYLEVRHPELDPANVRVTRDPYTLGNWMFIIQVSIPTMNDEQLLFEFCRYQCDSGFNSDDCASNLPASMGRGADYINIPKCHPLLIGDGDDSSAVRVRNHTVHIWLRDLED